MHIQQKVVLLVADAITKIDRILLILTGQLLNPYALIMTRQRFLKSYYLFLALKLGAFSIKSLRRGKSFKLL